jgi:(heptosyl)LPS beta-1,4-glucosyltransferase
MLSVVITTWNEANNLPRVVKSVRDLADEIVVVDTQSTDNTVAVAKKLECRVFHHPYTGIVEPVRNFSISKALGDWVLLLDADEEISESLGREIKKVISENKADYFRLPRQNVIFGRWIKSSHWWPDYVYRLFKKGFVVWDPAIHSIPQTRGVGRDFPLEEKFAITHHHYDSISQYIDRLNRYTDHQLNLLLGQKKDFSWPLLVTKPSQEFLNQYFARQGYKEGIHGLALAGLQAFSELVLYLKLWQTTGFKEAQVPQSQFHRLVTDQFRQLRWWVYENRGVIFKLWRKFKMIWI